MKNAGNGRNADAGMISKTFFRLTLLFFRAFPLSMPLTAFCIIYINYYQSANQLMIVNVLSVFDGEAVRRAMEWYDGRLPESAVRLPEIPYLCYQ